MLKYSAIVVSLTSLIGCSTTDTLFVGTYTRVGIDASQDGAGGGIGVKNLALTIAPTNPTGEAYDVIGTTDVDLGFMDFALSETLATGRAAKCASGKGDFAALVEDEKVAAKAAGPLIFVAGTSWSILEVGMGEAVGPGISLGYRRVVGVRMPIKNNSIGSTYASVSINTLKTDHPNSAKKTELNGTRSIYTFATGAASVNLAQKYAANVLGDPSQEGCQ